MTSDFLNHVVTTPTDRGFEYRAAPDNAAEIVALGEAKSLSDSQRAILLNLIEFGQDFESERSTTIKEVEFPVRDSQSCTVEKFLGALQADSDAAKEWPSEDHDRYFYQIRLEQNC